MAIACLDDAEFSAITQKFTNNSVRSICNGTSVTSAQLAVGRHRVVCDVDCYVAQGPSTVTAIAANSPYLPAKTIDYIFVSNATTQGYLASITNGGTNGTLDINKQ